ncbi:hypothetical protein C2E23DRAFT_863859 [Lenzites betulinus]|nr:hypothetical protein C2E23DRAFT_863859 [Lenzites betulinus]
MNTNSETPTRDSTRMRDIEKALSEAQQLANADGKAHGEQENADEPRSVAEDYNAMTAPPATPRAPLQTHESFPGTPSLLANAPETHAAPPLDNAAAPSPFRFGRDWMNERLSDPFDPNRTLETRPAESARNPAESPDAECVQRPPEWNAEEVRMGKRRSMSSPPAFTPSPTHQMEQQPRDVTNGSNRLTGASDPGTAAPPPPYLTMEPPRRVTEQKVSHIRTQMGWTSQEEEAPSGQQPTGMTSVRQASRELVTMPRKLAGELLNTMIPGEGDITLPANIIEALIQQARESAMTSGPFQGAVYAQQPRPLPLGRASDTRVGRCGPSVWDAPSGTSPDSSMDVNMNEPALLQLGQGTQSALAQDVRLAMGFGQTGHSGPGAVHDHRALALNYPHPATTQAAPAHAATTAPQPLAITYQQPLTMMPYMAAPATPQPLARTTPLQVMTGTTHLGPAIPRTPTMGPPLLIQREARAALSERTWTTGGGGGGAYTSTTRALAIPRTPTYVDQLIALGRANCMTTPEKGFPVPQGRGFMDATRYDSDARRTIWMGIPERQRCIIDVVSKHTFTVQEATRMTTELRKTIALVTGETAPFFVLPPEMTANQEKWMDGPPGWLPVGLSERSTRILVEHRLFVFREFAFAVLDGDNPQLPEHILTLEGITQDANFVYRDVVQTSLWTQAISHIRKIIEEQPQYNSDPDLYAKYFLETIGAEIEKQDEDVIVAHVSMMPPTKDEAKWLDWRKIVQKCEYGSGYDRDAKAHTLERCQACLATNHCLRNCPLLMIEGWIGPSRETIEVNNPRANAGGRAAGGGTLTQGSNGRTQIGSQGGMTGGAWNAAQSRGAGPSNTGHGGMRGGYGGFNPMTAHGQTRGGASTRPPKNGGRFQQRF